MHKWFVGLLMLCCLPTWADNNHTSQQFRDDVVHYVRDTAENKKVDDKHLDNRWFYDSNDLTPGQLHWAVCVMVYANGQVVGQGQASEKMLSDTLKTATIKAIKTVKNKNRVQAQFKIIFYSPPDFHPTMMVGRDVTAELIGNIVPIRHMDTVLIQQRIQAEKKYLLRIIDPKTHALFKLYKAETDQRETIFRTIYTASTLYTLLRVNAISPDPAIEKNIRPMADFLLRMQEKTGDNAGAFHYSYNTKTHKTDHRFVVGTASKTIFTLLLLYDRTHDQKYLQSAEQAGIWLMKKVDAKGRVTPWIARQENQQWQQQTKESLLYSGQVLSALSRLYKITHNKRYHDVASNIAHRMVQHIQKNGLFVGDDYRQPNSVSTSWVLMSLIDYAQISPTEPQYEHIIAQLAKTLLTHQVHTPWDAYNDGRLVDIFTSSGNGWINEVITELYAFSPKPEYRTFIINLSRWLVQNIYTSENSYQLKNPTMANGGAMRYFGELSVRTDAVCHGLNSLVGLMTLLSAEKIHSINLLTLPEEPFDVTLSLLRVGSLPEPMLQ